MIKSICVDATYDGSSQPPDCRLGMKSHVRGARAKVIKFFVLTFLRRFETGLCGQVRLITIRPACAEMSRARASRCLIGSCLKWQKRGEVGRCSLTGTELRLQSNGVRVLNAREARRAVHFGADHVEGTGESCRLRRSKVSFFTPDALKRIKRVGDLFESVLTLEQKLPSAFTQALAAGPPQKLSSWPRNRGNPRDKSLREYAAKRDHTKTPEPAALPVGKGRKTQRPAPIRHPETSGQSPTL